jgi:hypothetical protein
MAKFNRTKDNPLPLKTPPGTADFTIHTDAKDGLQILVCTVAKTEADRYTRQVLPTGSQRPENYHPANPLASERHPKRKPRSGNLETWRTSNQG